MRHCFILAIAWGAAACGPVPGPVAVVVTGEDAPGDDGGDGGAGDTDGGAGDTNGGSGAGDTNGGSGGAGDMGGGSGGAGDTNGGSGAGDTNGGSGAGDMGGGSGGAGDMGGGSGAGDTNGGSGGGGPGDTNGGTAAGGGFVGAACDADGACALDGAFCMVDEEGWPAGTCTLPCTHLCPDDPSSPTTFCVADPGGDGGVCVSRCDPARFGGDGCRAGYACVDTARFDDPATVRGVCVPAGLDAGGASDGQCVATDLPTPNAGIEEPPGLDGCPRGMALVGDTGVCMDRWEAFLVVVDDSGAELPFSPFENPAAHEVRAKSAPGAVPQGYISGLEAAGACAAAGKRLCKNPEWTRACRGAGNTVYPYGDTREPGVCNDARAVHPAVEYFGTSADWIWSSLGHPCINQQHDTVDLTGENAGCVDDSGRFFDLMGNLHEWIDDPAGTFRGGYYVDTHLNGDGCLYTTTAHDTSHWDYSTGFRCCADHP